MSEIIFECAYRDINLTSVNRKYKSSPKFIDNKKHLTELFRLEHNSKKMYIDPCSLIIYIYTAKDIDNCNKIIQDALQDAEIIKDDAQIHHSEVFLIRASDKREKEKICIQLLKIKADMVKKLLWIEKFLNSIKQIKLWEKYD